MGINKNKDNDVSETYAAQKYIHEIMPTLSENDINMTNMLIDEVNNAGYYIKYLFELSWMDKDDFDIVDNIIMRYVLMFDRWQIRNSLIRYIGKRGNYFVTDFLLELFYKENDYHEGKDWNSTLRGVCSSAIENIRDKTKINEYINIIENPATRDDSYLIIILLGELKVDKAIPLFIEVLNKEDVMLQSAAIQALTYFKKNKELISVLTPFTFSKHEVIREYAKKALKQIN